MFGVPIGIPLLLLLRDEQFLNQLGTDSTRNKLKSYWCSVWGMITLLLVVCEWIMKGDF